jgi:hypothetical protein
VVEVAARPGKPLTRKAAAESPASTSKMAPAEAAAQSTPAATAVSATTSPAVRSKRVSGQSSGESGSRSQNDHRLT